VVERSLAWLTAHRRLVRDYERHPATSRGHDPLGGDQRHGPPPQPRGRPAAVFLKRALKHAGAGSPLAWAGVLIRVWVGWNDNQDHASTTLAMAARDAGGDAAAGLTGLATVCRSWATGPDLGELDVLADDRPMRRPREAPTRAVVENVSEPVPARE
jgi:hypothetical protein